jgi:hypothetical protein
MRLRPVGVALVAVGLVVNKWSLARVLAPDGTITSGPVIAAIVLFQLGCVAAGWHLARRNPMLPAVFGGLPVLALSLLASIVTAECLLRLLPEFRPVPRWYVGERSSRTHVNWEPDSLTGWRMKPHSAFNWIIGGEWTSYRANAQGMRAPFDFEAACKTRPIVLVGDSFFFGTGVEYPQTVGAALADSLSFPAGVYDLAMPGFGMDQIWMSLRHRVLHHCPALVVVGFIDADWDRSLTAYREGEDMTKPTFVLRQDSLRPATPSDRPGLLGRLLSRHSSLRRLGELARRKQAYLSGGGEWWRLNTAILAAMLRDAEAAQVPIVFLRLPTKDEWRAFPALRAEMKRQRAQYIDLADPSAMRPDIHLARDPHLSAHGTVYVASRILDWMRSTGHATPRMR